MKFLDIGLTTMLGSVFVYVSVWRTQCAELGANVAQFTYDKHNNYNWLPQITGPHDKKPKPQREAPSSHSPISIVFP